MKGRIGVLLLTVHDFPKMLGFYRDAMGLKVSSIHPGVGYQPLVDWARFEFGEGTALELFAESRPGSRKDIPYPRENAVIIAFQLEDIDEAIAELSERGVVFPKGIGEEEWGRYVHFKDPEGNRLQLYQPQPGY